MAGEVDVSIEQYIEQSRQQDTPSFPTIDNEYFEWIDLLDAVDASVGTFTMVELGAGFGRWTVRGVAAARQRALEPRVRAVEAEPTHFQWLSQHLADNDVVVGDADLMQAAVADKPGRASFWIGNPSGWYGQAHAGVADPESLLRKLVATPVRSLRYLKHRRDAERLVMVPAVPLQSVLVGLDRVDFMDLDVQGAELEVLGAAPQLLTDKVARVHIGTHSLEVEAGLTELFTGLGWSSRFNFSLQGIRETPFGPIGFGDGVQSWLNPALA